MDDQQVIDGIDEPADEAHARSDREAHRQASRDRADVESHVD
jgi:hypothetical protein